ncbi:MAG TPA: helix-turn-helix transcriptional regulator [Pseudonocardiaceae bacterium]|nr:helix-turn-helix transcriptional regulator [Pseudonocardiaceae bacterium]
MDLEDPRTIGARLRQIRRARRKSLRVVAGLAGMSKSKLDRIERGEVALDSRSDTVALANALGISPSELTKLPVPAPCNGGADAAVEAVRLALIAVSRNRPRGKVAGATELRARARAVEGSDYRRRGELLPGLIRDLHMSIMAGHDVAELLSLAVLVHAQTTRGYLYIVGAPLDLRREPATLAQRAAEDLDEPTMLGVAAWGAVIEMLAAGAFDLAQDELDSVTVPTTSPESTQLAGMLALSGSLVAAADKRPGDVEAALDHAAELAQRTGQGNAYLMGFGPTNVGLWRMAAALEVKDYERAAAIAEDLNPAEHPSRERQATYWMDRGRALARMRGRQDDAVRALRTAEELFPMRVLRNTFARETLAELLYRSRRDAIGMELRGMAYRAGLPV